MLQLVAIFRVIWFTCLTRLISWLLPSNYLAKTKWLNTCESRRAQMNVEVSRNFPDQKVLSLLHHYKVPPKSKGMKNRVNVSRWPCVGCIYRTSEIYFLHRTGKKSGVLNLVRLPLSSKMLRLSSAFTVFWLCFLRAFGNLFSTMASSDIPLYWD